MSNSENEQLNTEVVESNAETEQTVSAEVVETMEEVKVSAVSNRKLVMYNLKQIAILFVAALATAASLELFLLPSNVVAGGALGIASIMDILLSHDGSKWYFSAGIWLFAANIPIIIYCFARFRRRFAVKTLLYISFLSVLLLSLRLLNLSEKFEHLMYGDGSKDKVIYIILGGALHGISLPMILSVNASAGGSDIVALIMQKRSRQSSSTAMRIIMVTNIAVVFLSAVVLWAINKDVAEAVNMFIYSVAAIFICEIVQEWIFKGFSAALELEITTDKPQEMAAALQESLKHGTTTVKVMGGYSRQEKTMILCVVNKSQLAHARKIINQTDPNAFAYVENVKEVVGKGFANKENDLENE